MDDLQKRYFSKIIGDINSNYAHKTNTKLNYTNNNDREFKTKHKRNKMSTQHNE